MSGTVTLAAAARIIGEQVMTLKSWRFLGIGRLAELGTRPGRNLELNETDVLQFALVAALHGRPLSLLEAAAKADSLMPILGAVDFIGKEQPVYAVEALLDNELHQYIVEGHMRLLDAVTEFAGARSVSILNLSELRARVYAGLQIAEMGAVAFKEWAATQRREGKIEDSDLAKFNRLADQVAPLRAPRASAKRHRSARTGERPDRTTAAAE